MTDSTPNKQLQKKGGVRMMIPPGYYQLKLVILMGLGSSFAKSWLLAMYGMSSFVPRPFPICTFCACAAKRGRGGKERVWKESAYPLTDPGRNEIVGDKYA